MKLPWIQLAALLLILTIGAASMGPPPSRGGQARPTGEENWLAHQPTVRKVVPAGAVHPSFSANAAKRIADASQTTTLVRVQCPGQLEPAAGHVRWQPSMDDALGMRPKGLAKSLPNLIGSAAALRLGTRLLIHRYLQPLMCIVRLAGEIS